MISAQRPLTKCGKTAEFNHERYETHEKMQETSGNRSETERVTLRKAPEGRSDVAWGVSPRCAVPNTHLLSVPPRPPPQLRSRPGVGAAAGVERPWVWWRRRVLGLTPQATSGRPHSGARKDFPDSL